VLISFNNTKKNVDFPCIYDKSKKKHIKRGKNEQKTTGHKNIIFDESQQS
tara:strand:+ start:352 stop:501 length:150 start_codon:yes stop_codon:yes gene_type:complete